MSTLEAKLQSQKVSLTRATRYLAKSRNEVRQAMEDMESQGGSGGGQLANLGAKMKVLKDQLINVDNLLTAFEQLAAETQDDPYKNDEETWGDLVFECQGVHAEAEQVVQGAMPSQHGGNPSASPSPSGNLAAHDTENFGDQFSRLLTLLEQQQMPAGRVPSNGNNNRGSQNTYSRLPKLELPKFEGDLLKWKPFWDRFAASVDQNENLASVDKLNYLISMLGKEPLMLVESLPMTSENYDTAKTLLKSKYGDEKMVIALLYRQLNEMKPVKNEPTSLRRFVAEIDCLLGSLGSMGQNTSDDNLATIILSKLPSQVVILLEITKDVAQAWTVALVRSKLADYLVRLERTAKVSAVSKDGSSGNPFDRTADMLFADEQKDGGKSKGASGSKKQTGGGQKGKVQPKKVCAFCDGAHFSDRCEKYPTADERFKRVGKRCRVCLSTGHYKKDCKSKKPCFYCKVVGDHHSSLCFRKFGRSLRDGPQSGLSADSKPFVPNGDKKDQGDESDSSLLASGEGVALQTAKIPVQSGPKSSMAFVVTHGLFDPGANRSYCSEHLARQLGMKLQRGPSLKVNRFGSDNPVDVSTQVGKLRLRKLDGKIETIEVSVIPKITGRLVRMPIHSPALEKVRNRVKLADDIPTKYEQNTVDLLIGNDYYLDFVTGEKIALEKGLYLLGSEFGYILSGRSSISPRGGYAMSMCGFTCGSLAGLDEMVAIPKGDSEPFKKPEMSDFWSLETIGIKDDPTATSDELAVQNFEENVGFQDGRYFVGLPWNDNATELKTNYNLSLGRLNSLVKRLKDNPELFKTYADVIDDQLKKGVIEKVDERSKVPKTHYIPHHAVIDPNRETTKVRVVYDGSAKVRKDTPSLNECLHRGPVLLEDLAGLLMRFRTHKYAIIADIEKAFLQIGIQPADRDLLRFLWLKDPTQMTTDGNLQAYRFARVVFGLNCSPSLLAQTVQHHLNQVGTSICKQISENLYADNVITGVESVAEGKTLYGQAKTIFKKASMNLRQWTSNSAEIMKEIPEEDRIKNAKPKVLGLQWHKERDELSVTENPKMKKEVETKREFLSCLSTVFDPLGFFTPVTLNGKVLLQRACESKPNWDTKLEPCIIREWEEQRRRVEEIPRHPIPRYIPCLGKCKLVAFSDASSVCFATVVYLRSETDNGVNVNLIMSKNRLNPVKKLTMPRLELMGVLIGVRALNFVAKSLKLPKKDAVLFTDSSCALSWLKAQKKQDLFVRNRVKEIAKTTWVTFRYVNTGDNPADWATRGKDVSDLEDFWWKGPAWVQIAKSSWPTWGFAEVTAQEVKPEGPPIHQISLPAEGQQVDPVLGIEIEDYSSLTKLVRITAWCLRFLNNLKKGARKSKCLAADELYRAKTVWEIQVQSESYATVKNAIKENRQHPMAQLSIFVDSEGLLRCKGRMAKSGLEWETKYPKLLPKGHKYTRLLVENVHASCGHASVSQTLSEVRRNYWIPKGRQLVKSVVETCVVCKKAAGRPFARPEMPELPPDRVNPQPCFTSTGVDYFGPVKLKGPKGTEKAWVALFTCLTTRAVHLELVMDLSAEEFLLAFRRFISRRGKPSIMTSDNAPQFKMIAKTLDVTWNTVLQDPSILDFSAHEGIKWSFIVEYAPYMGGVYERLVGIVKTCLRKTLFAALLTPKQFETVLFECEAIVNTRPLAYVGSDLEDDTVLTPAHFLTLNPRIAVPDFPQRLLQDRDLYRLSGSTFESLVSCWKKGQNLLNEFWARWKDEYLAAIRERTSYRHKHNQGSTRLPEPGDVVILKEASLPRGSWKIAKVAKIHQGNDGLIRSATVDLPSGRSLNRPINLLIPLECGSKPSCSDKKGSTERQIQSEDESEGRASPELFAQDFVRKPASEVDSA